MTRSDYTHISLVVDRSGSMDAIRGDAEGAINSFIDEQKQAPGRATFTLVEFDSVVETVHENVDIQTVGKYKLRPRDMTALFDAWGRTMTKTGEFLASLSEDERPGNVIFVVVTDGHENASREFTQPLVKEMTERQRNDYNWQVVFLAANMDAVKVGAQFGVAAGSSLTYGASSQGAQASYQALSNVVTAVRSGTSKSIKFSAEDREAAK
jgi:hypothetical protein